MKSETKLLTRKLVALVLSAAMVVSFFGMNSFEANAAEAEISIDPVIYEDTYYQGFNGDICIATGTTIDICRSNYEPVEDFELESLAKDKDDIYYVWFEPTYGGEKDLLYMKVYYEDDAVHGDFYTELDDDGNPVGNPLAKRTIYEVNNKSLDDMPTIAVGEEQIVATADSPAYFIKYYRVISDGKCEAFTLKADSGYDDTLIKLYDGDGMLLDKDDDNGDDAYSDFEFIKPDDEERIIGVSSYSYYSGYGNDSPLQSTKLKLIAGAKGVDNVKLADPNIDNIRYRGFNDNLIIASGTRINVTFDNGRIKTRYIDEYIEKPGEKTYWGIKDDLSITFERHGNTVNAVIVSWNDEEEQFETPIYDKKLFDIELREVSSMPQIKTGENNLKTKIIDNVYYYRITAGNTDEQWTLKLNQDKVINRDDYYLVITENTADGKKQKDENWYYEWNEKDEDRGEYEFHGNDFVIDVPAGETRVIGIERTDWYDADDINNFITASMKKTSEPKGDDKKDDPKPSPSKSDVFPKGKTFTANGANYKVTSNVKGAVEVSYVAPAKTNKKSYTVPATVKLSDGRAAKVTSIAPKAFAKCKKMTKLTVGKNVKKIGANACKGCKKLKKIVIKTSLLKMNTVGKNAFGGINKKATAKVPKKVLKSYKKILKKRGMKGKKQKIKK